MQIHPIIKALRRHKVGVAIIVVQVAITLAIVSNALMVIGERIHRLHRPTGMEESGLYLITQTWINAPDISSAEGISKLDAMQREDLAKLRGIQGVISVSAVSSLPLLNASRIANIRTSLDGDSEGQTASLYYSDEDTLKTLGLKLISGRNFFPTEVKNGSPMSKSSFPVAIVTQELAARLYPDGHALGSQIYINGQSPSTIIGIVDKLQVPGIGSWFTSFAYNSVLVPCRLNLSFSRYAVRAEASDNAYLYEKLKEALFSTNRLRVIEANGIQSFSSIRRAAYQADMAMATLMAVICIVLLTITAAGIFGLSSFWVAQRRKQIGLRRALGATRADILKHYQTETLLISAFGAALGLLLSVYCNELLMKYVEMSRLPWPYLVTGFFLLIVLTQCAAFVPSRKASTIEPIIATKT